MDEPKDDEEFYLRMLSLLSKRLNALADREAKVASAGLTAIEIPEKRRLIDQIDKVLAKLEAINGEGS